LRLAIPSPAGIRRTTGFFEQLNANWPGPPTSAQSCVT
jgi:hypothetical protein